LAQTVTPPPVQSLDTDGLVGRRTMEALINAQQWVNTLGLDWFGIVALG
jgi:hypothetical protein